MNPIPLIIGAAVIGAFWYKRRESGVETGLTVAALLILAMAAQ